MATSEGRPGGARIESPPIASSRRRSGTVARAALLRAGLWSSAVLAVATPAAAERLPLKGHTTTDGLAHDHVQCIVPDSRGFLWLCTAQGLSRFDGRRFVTYGRPEGLGELYVNDFIETRRGDYWVATNGGGAFRFDPSPTQGRDERRLFVRHPVGDSSATNRVNSVFEDRGGGIWAGTDDGLFRLDAPGTGGTFQRVALPAGPPRIQVWDFEEDEHGRLWIATSAGVFLGKGERSVAHHARLGATSYASLLADGQGRLWAGHRDGVAIVDTANLEPTAHAAVEAVRRAFGGKWVRAIHRLSDGRIFLGSYAGGGLGAWNGERLSVYTTAHGLTDDWITSLAEDRGGNLWIGTATGGALRLARSGFVSFDVADGLGHSRAISIFETQAGELCVLSALRHLNRYDGGRFASMRPRLDVPATVLSHHSVLQDRRGEWWIATGSGLARWGPAPSLAALAGRPAAALYTTRDGLGGDDVSWPHEDARGDIWVGAQRKPILTRWERATGSFHRYTAADGLPEGSSAIAFANDARGVLWVGFREGGLARYDGGRFTFFGERHGVPNGMTRDLYVDIRGRLWAATTGGGLVRVEKPSSDRPRFVRYTTADGLSNDHIRAIAGDAQGRLYLGTARGVERLDMERGTVTHYTTADGLAQNEIQAAYGDAHGALWFATMRGVSRFVPQPDQKVPPTPVLIGAVAVEGIPLPLSPLGERSVGRFTVGPGRGGVRIDFVGLAFTPGETLLFEYRLGDSGTEWSAPTARDSVEYAALAPGRYRFEVRARPVTGNGAGEPASVTFEVLTPVWRRWWFVTLASTSAFLLAFQLHRSRLRRVVELEHVRTRIASDLHDDIGSNLSQIAILSEVAARDLQGHERTTRQTLAGIAAASREAVDSMSEIVWAINPDRDHLGDLVHRMRRFASDVFTARDVELRFEAPIPTEDVPVGADVRRHVLLFFKECVNNAARHSGGTSVEALVAMEDGGLVVRLTDDGRGFDPQAAPDGHGLTSMRSRARALGGTMSLTSRPGQGTVVVLRVPRLRSGTGPWGDPARGGERSAP